MGCPNNTCTYNANSDPHGKDNYVPEKDSWRSELLAYKYVINVFTTTSMTAVFPITLAELGVSSIITLATLYSMSQLTSNYASLLITVKYSMSAYEYKLRELLAFMTVSVHISW